VSINKDAMSWCPEWHSKLKKGVSFDTPFKDKSCIVAKDASLFGGSKAYCAPPDMETFVTWVNTLPAAEKCFYELLLEDIPRKLYFDLEVVGGQKTNPTEAETEVIITALVRRVTLAAKVWYDIEVTRDDFALLSACSETKWSYHMVLKSKFAFDGHASMFEFVDKWFRQGENPELHGFLDLAVWGKNQCWRMPDSSKYGQDRPLRIQPNLDGQLGWYGDCVVSWFPDFPGEVMSLRPKKSKPPAGAVSVPLSRPPIFSSVRHYSLAAALAASWFINLVLWSTVGRIESYRIPPESEEVHHDLLIVHSTAVVILEMWTKISVFFCLMFMVDVN